MKKKINIPLIILVTALWGFIIYSVAEVAWFNIVEQQIEEEANHIKLEDYSMNKSGNDFVFETLEIDPFSTTSNKETVKSSVNDQPIQKDIHLEEPIIEFGVCGVIINGNSKKIVFNDFTHSNVVFLEEGDIYQGLEVLKISKNQVEFLQISTSKKHFSTIQ